MEKPIISQDYRDAAGELCNAKRIDGNVFVVHDEHDEDHGSDKDVQRVEDDFELHEAENLTDERRRLSCELKNAGDHHGVAAKVISALVHLVDG